MSRKLNWSGIALDLVYIALGVVFIVRPEGMESILCYLLAIAVAVMGVLYLLGYFIRKANDSEDGGGFVLGILLIILAVFIIVKQDLVIALVPFLFGVMVTIRGLMILQGVFTVRRMGVGIGIPLLIALLTIFLGLFIMMFPFDTAAVLFVLIGISLVEGGVAGLVQEIMIWNMLRKQEQELERIRDMEGAADAVMTVSDSTREAEAEEDDQTSQNLE